MEIYIITLVSMLGSLLTFFSGFGLGTILTPVLVVFFPIDIAIALTGIVHLLNNFFKIGLVGKYIDWEIGFRFGILSILGAFLGALLLNSFSNQPPIYTYTLHGKQFFITAIKLVISILMILFALFETIPKLKNIQFERNALYGGGLISGFFGGLSGNQGALRSMFLIRSGLSKEGFVATGILVACAVDLTRLSVYFSRLSSIPLKDNINILVAATTAAFIGAYLGSKLLKKVTLGFVQITVTVLIVILALGLGSGLL
jgi:uncharacterized protein